MIAYNVSVEEARQALGELAEGQSDEWVMQVRDRMYRDVVPMLRDAYQRERVRQAMAEEYGRKDC